VGQTSFPGAVPTLSRYPVGADEARLLGAGLSETNQLHGDVLSLNNTPIHA